MVSQKGRKFKNILKKSERHFRDRENQREMFDGLKKLNKLKRGREYNSFYGGIKEGTHSDLALKKLQEMTGKTKVDVVRDAVIFYYYSLKRELESMKK